MRRRIAVAAVAVFAAVLLPSLPASASAQKSRTLYVSATAGSNGNGSRQAPYGSLSAVQNAAAPGDEIVVLPAPPNIAPLDGGIALKAGQKLVGAGPPVTSLTGSAAA